MSEGQTRAGGASSTTVTVNSQRLSFPEPSVAVHSMTWLPGGSAVPDGGVQTTSGAGSHSSLTSGAGYVTMAVPPSMHGVWNPWGHVISGGDSSVTVTWKVHLASFPARSRAVQVTVVVPEGNTW